MAITELSMLELLLIVIVRFTLRSMRHPPPVHCRLPLPSRARELLTPCTFPVLTIVPLAVKSSTSRRAVPHETDPLRDATFDVNTSDTGVVIAPVAVSVSISELSISEPLSTVPPSIAVRASTLSKPLVVLGALMLDPASAVRLAVTRGSADAIRVEDINESDPAGVNCLSFVHVLL